MLSVQMVHFLETVIVFLLITNAASVLVAICAIRLSGGSDRRTATQGSFGERKIETIVRRPSPVGA
jgi:hypothetical protein